MTQAEKKLMQDTHDIVIQLKQMIMGNGVEGIAKRVQKHDKLYYKLMGALSVLLISNGYLIFFR